MKALFIVGFWNSGTTLLVDVLRKHPDLVLKKARYKPNLEERTTKKILKKLGTDFWDFKRYEEVVENGFENYEEPIFNAEKEKRFLKKFKWHFGVRKNKMLLLKNPWLFYFYEFINKTFRNYELKKVVILRSGYSQTVSKDYWLRDKNFDNETHLIRRAIFWRKSVERFFETWYNDKNCLTIRYENLCAEPEKVTKAVCDFLDLSFEPLKNEIPKAMENRMTKWNELDNDLKIKVANEIDSIQQKLDTYFPV